MQRIYVSVNKMAITSNHAQQDFVWSLKRWDTWSLIWIHLSSLACNTLIFHEGHSWFHATAQMSPPWWLVKSSAALESLPSLKACKRRLKHSEAKARIPSSDNFGILQGGMDSLRNWLVEKATYLENHQSGQLIKGLEEKKEKERWIHRWACSMLPGLTSTAK
jgi:hypothetical protein